MGTRRQFNREFKTAQAGRPGDSSDHQWVGTRRESTGQVGLPIR
jgi:hypothetical protein